MQVLQVREIKSTDRPKYTVHVKDKKKILFIMVSMYVLYINRRNFDVSRETRKNFKSYCFFKHPPTCPINTKTTIYL